jgi:putative IMPACT (imprinted ancient) family translation regulator
VRAYTDSVAQALLKATKVPRQRLRHLHCQVPYALEGWLRRQLDTAGASLGEVTHGSLVEVRFSLPDSDADALVKVLEDGGQGRLGWIKPD